MKAATAHELALAEQLWAIGIEAQRAHRSSHGKAVNPDAPKFADLADDQRIGWVAVAQSVAASTGGGK